MSFSMKRSFREYNGRADADFYRELERQDEMGSFSKCAAPGCNEECNPSNVHASGKKYCDDCWEKSDDE